MTVSYKTISKIYGLLDIIYFRKKNNPRHILLNKIPDEKIQLLDIAIGTAQNSILLAKHKPNINIIGIDLSEEMLEIAKNSIEKDNLKNIKLIKMNAIDMTFKNEMFNAIIISLLLHEIKESIANNILKECHKVLKNDGKLYILEWEEPKKIIQKILFSIIKIMEQLTNKEFKIFLKKDLNNYFLKNGFQINSIEYGDYSKVIELIKI